MDSSCFRNVLVGDVKGVGGRVIVVIRNEYRK